MKHLRPLYLIAAAITTLSAIADGFDQRDVTVRATDGIVMGATLTTPADGKPIAAIVLATGSGTQNRDEEIAGKKPFKTIAEFLSSNGYAVLRIDDRGIDNPASAATATMQTCADDVAAAVAVADSIFPDIPTGILGHSAGANYAIVNAPRVDFIITLAAPAWAGDSIIMSQARAIANATVGKWDGEALQRSIMQTAKSPMPTAIARGIITSTINQSLGEAAHIPQVQQQVQQQVEGVLSPWYRSFLRYDPAADIAAVAVPWLALNGSRDTQVLPANLDTINSLNPHADTRLLDAHNHLFQIAATGLPNEYATLPGDISPLTLSTILAWLPQAIK